jgi:hypothetical protein
MVASREDILSYLQVLLGTMSGIVLVARDRGQLENDQKPGILLLDGSESIHPESIPDRLKSVKMPPALMVLKIEVILIAKERDDASNMTVGGVDQPIGPELSHWLDLTQRTILNDEHLTQMLTTTGQMKYIGHETDMVYGSSFVGALNMHFEFTYPWFPPHA